MGHLKGGLVFVWLYSLTLLALCVSVSGQEIRKPEQIDVFGRINCDEFGARSQAFANQISNDPSSKGLVIVRTLKKRQGIVQRQFRVMIAHFAYFNSEDRVEFVINPDADEEVWQLWRVPPGAAEPAYTGEKWPIPAPNVTKAFIYDYEDEDGICSTFVPRKFAELLLANPGSRANVVIKSGSYESAQAIGFADDTIETLVKKFKVDRSRIRTFYVRQKAKNSMTYAEYWFVPAKHRPAVSK